ncbi:YqhG family protein [Caenibacillus caldisaponilyticus]|uniref:YqhG family protein n=1 Tax=Caenibacillus caldisaponilyticus TaxID=1674942 RepID=UPI0009886DB9|nr:YqhG family protein [Caenibacillus caldisaponilyticus]
MKQEAIHSYLEDFFRASGCDILDLRPRFIKVKLTIEMDKKLMNRPFYWHYVEKIGARPETQTLAFKTDPAGEEGDFIHFGSPRLHHIFSLSKELGRYVRLYENARSNGGNLPLYPWLGLNFKISFQCDLKRDELMSLGINLFNGTIVKAFQETVEALPLSPKIPDYCYTLAPMIKPLSAVNRLFAVIEAFIHRQDDAWALEARERLRNDLELLERFYEDMEGDAYRDAFEKERDALMEQYKPRIHVSIINGGLFYLTGTAF